MANVQSLAEAVAAVVSTIEGVDRCSVTDFTPALNTQAIAAMIVPMGQSSAGRIVSTLSNRYLEMTTTLPVEFWVKHAQGDPATTMRRARNVGTDAIAALLAADGTGYELAPDAEITESIESAFVEVSGQPYLVATVRIPIRNVVEV